MTTEGNHLYTDDMVDSLNGITVERVLHYTGRNAQADAEADAPAVGDPHPTRKARRAGYTLGVSEVSIKQRGSTSFNYEMRIQYEERTPPTSPLDIPVDWTGTTRRVRTRTIFNGDGKPILNSAGSVKTIERELVIQVFTAAKNFASSPNFLRQLEDSTNANAYQIDGITFPPGTLSFSGLNIGARTTDSNTGESYKPVTFNVEYNVAGWTRSIENTGREELTADGELVPCVADDGSPLASDQWLDDAGRMYRDEDDNLRRDLSDAEYLTFDVEPAPRKPFPVLN